MHENRQESTFDLGTVVFIPLHYTDNIMLIWPDDHEIAKHSVNSEKALMPQKVEN